MHVRCPFPHVDKDGKHYYEQVPSAHINLERSVFHCKVCAQGMSEASFLAKVNGISWIEAKHILAEMEKRESDTEIWQRHVDNLKNSPQMMAELKQLGLETMVDELQIGFRGDGLAFPVFAYGSLLDVRTYNPDSRPKVMSEKGTGSNIIPFDLWVNDERPTLLCAGEKDMAIARKHGFNAITFTGGEQSFPKLWKGSMRGKTFYIVYDNDSAGHDGAIRVATLLKEIGANPYVVTGHYEVCTEKGEDIHDFFVKYHKTADDLKHILDKTEAFSEDLFAEQRNIIYPLVRLEESSQGRYSKRLISSRVAVVAEYDTPMKIPAIVTFRKYDLDASQSGINTMKLDEEKVWSVYERNMQDILLLCDGTIKEKDLITNLKAILGIPAKEKYITVRTEGEIPIWKATVSDDIESEIVGQDYKPSELTLYSIEQRLYSGQKYRVFYKSVAHPLQAMKVVGVSNRAEESDNSISRFKMTDDIKKSLECFQGEPEAKMKELAERMKAIAGPETRSDIAFTVDLFYHTPLQFKFGERLERGYLDCMLIGDPRTGKSQTAKKLLETYELGTFVSLKSATTQALIGGSQGTSNGGYKTRLGIIPRNHKSALILEEFSGAPPDMISKLTEIRSSNKVRIHRVSGDMSADAFVRMLTISNQRTSSAGQTIPLRQYPDGIHVITDLIGASEDIARYDFFILVEKPDGYTSPLTKVDVTPYPKESYLNRIRWVWSRKPEQILLSEEVREYIVECANALNKSFDSHIGFFGAEAWKKVSRVAIACAGCCASMDESGENLIVKNEHVQWASRFLKDCYDNELFRLRNYVDEERAYTVVSDKAISALQGIFNRNKALVNQMERSTEITQNQLRAISGLSNDDFNKIMNHLAECRFFRWSGNDKIIPSERFRKALAKLRRNVYPQTIGSE